MICRQTVILNGVQYTNVARVERHDGTWSPYYHGPCVYFNIPQLIDIGEKTYKSVSSFKLYENWALEWVKFATPQSIDIGGKTYENVKCLEFKPDGSMVAHD